MKYLVMPLLAAIVGSAVFAAGAASSGTKVKPSKAAAIKAVKKEIRSDSDYALLYAEGSTLHVNCSRLTNRLYKCTFDAHAPDFAEWFGKAKAKFLKYGIDVTLYGVKCFNDGNAVSDYCH